MKNLFYFRHLNVIGGIEQFFVYLSEKYHDWDITILYKTGDPQQIARLRKYVKLIKFTGQTFKCDKAFFCFNFEIKDCIDAKEKILMLHGDYKTMVEQHQLDKDCYIFNEWFDSYYGVSKVVCDAWTELTGKKCKLVYNPFIKQDTKKILRLVYCGRLTLEKGGDLVTKLAKRLDERKIDYQLFVYSNKDTIEGNSVFFLGTKPNACQYLNKDNYDYIIIPSKNEGYCYSLVQALANGLPAVTTPCPVFKEIGVDETNSITIDFEGENIDDVIDQMLTKELDFKYTPKKDGWKDVLVPGKSTYTPHTVRMYTTERFYDTETDTHYNEGDEFETSIERANDMVDANVAMIIKEN